MTSPQSAPGWYPDPSGGPGQRYWDGQQWQAAGAPQPSAAVAPYGAAPYGGMNYGVDAYGRPLSDKSKLVAGLLQIFLGGLGIGRFYLGYSTIGVLQLVTFGGCGVWALIDAIMILMGNVPDAQGRTLRE
ncbi:MAG: NINE protein [Mycobacterium sp.]|uniref:NINE protein n=1 Tax=Mycobacterium sp. TaxID=1785 RepID=UPI003BAE15DF